MRPQAFWERTEGWPALVLSIAAVFLGLIGAIAAFILYRLIMLFTNLFWYQRLSIAINYPPQIHIAPWMILIPTVGGFVVGLMAYYGTDRIRGHGIPEAMEAVITKKSRVHPKVAILKPISAAIAVGTGGPFGAEGPIIQTGGAIASLIGQALHLTSDERKVFLACGAAAGMVGIFNTPMAAVALTIELLLFEFRARSIIPVVIASAVAAAARTFLIGPQRMFPVPAYADATAAALVLYIPLGIIVGAAAVAVSKALFFAEEMFEDKLHLSMIAAPAVGGFILGLVAYVDPKVLGMGYATIQAVIDGKLGMGESLELAVLKAIALIASLGSGTSGGLLAPMLLIGGALGSTYGSIVAPLFPSLGLSPNVCAIVAMSALFSAASRAPFTSFLFAYELTGDDHAIVPLMVGCMVADIVARLMTEHSVMTARLAQRGVAIPASYEADVLSYLKVGSLMRTDFRVVPAETPVRAILAELLDSETSTQELTPQIERLRQHHWWAVIEPDGTFDGIITRRQVLQAQHDPVLLDGSARELANPNLVVAYPSEDMRDALTSMLQSERPLLPVVSQANPRDLLGYVTREDALEARRQRLTDEVLREGILNFGSFRNNANAARTIQKAAESAPSPEPQKVTSPPSS